MTQRIWQQWLPGNSRLVRGSVKRCTECSTSAGIWDYLTRREDGIRLQAGWCCSPKCLDRAAEREFSRLVSQPLETGQRRVNRMPLGLILLSRGIIDRSQLEKALLAQRSAGYGRIGDWLQQMGFATENEVTKALSLQWGCPILKTAGVPLAAANWIPRPLVIVHGMAPVQYIPTTRKLYVACSRGIDRSALYAVEQMLDCQTEPCVIAESTLRHHLDLSCRKADDDIVFETDQSSPDMARITRSYALQLHADEMRIVRCGPYIWTRLKYGASALNLLFRAARAVTMFRI